MSKVIKSFRLIDSIPRILASENRDSDIEENNFGAEYFFVERMNLENKKLELEIAKEQILLEAKRQAEAILVKAKQDAEETLVRAEMQQEEIKEQYRQVGLDEGKAEGLRQAELETANYIQEAQLVLEKAKLEREEIITGTEEEIILLTLDIAKKIIVKEIELGPGVIKEIVQQAIKKATHRERVIIRVNAADLEYVQKERERLRERSGSQDLIILSDPTVGPGGCVLETDLGTVDARIDTQLNQIRETLLKIAKEKEADHDKLS